MTDRVKHIGEYIFLFSWMGIFSLFCFYKSWKINKYGVYAIAKKTGITRGGKHAATSDYTYSLNNGTYELSITDYGRGVQYIFIKVLPGNLEENIVVNTPVPDCLLNDSSLNKRWDLLPGCDDK